MMLIFIDADAWLGFWKVDHDRHSGELIPALLSLKDRLFITAQTAYEVERQKLACFAAAGADLQSISSHPLPTHLCADGEADDWKKQIQRLRAEHQDLLKARKEAFARIAEEISRGTDGATSLLKPLFDAAVQETSDELQRARLRRERGNPPGKQGDKLGDQISWEQILNVAAGNEVWLVSNDNDYSVLIDRQARPNATLHREIMERGAQDFLVFRTLAEMIKHASAAVVGVKDAPTPERLDQIANEEKKPARRIPIVQYGPASGPCPVCEIGHLVGPGARPGPFGFAWYSTCANCEALIFVDDYCD